MEMQQALKAVQQRIHNAATHANRAPKSVQLIAVSKTKPLSNISQALGYGQVHFGENYAQELRDKSRAFDPNTHPCPHWHFIGHIQRNKAKYIAPVAYRIHALENRSQAEALVRRAPRGVDALVAVNIAHEPGKSGVLPKTVIPHCQELSTVKGLRLRGLMCMPPPAEDPEASAPFFEELSDLALLGQQNELPLTELSMGMSRDFEVAIRYHATWIRVGTAIFGARERRA